MHAATFLALLVILCGCRSAPPVVTSSDGAFLTISQPRGDKQAAAKALADQTCGRHAMLLSKLCTDPKCDQEELKFWCGKAGGGPATATEPPAPDGAQPTR